ncbi:hypothetical protein [Povalibacter sp.]|uniref:hypothetical protein n=1 Tax=Povalibacter sp. TaxID=1962978 RepID=UPI0032C23F5E
MGRLIPHNLDKGNRPATLILILILLALRVPKTLGRLIVLYEHNMFAQSVIWGINALGRSWRIRWRWRGKIRARLHLMRP